MTNKKIPTFGVAFFVKTYKSFNGIRPIYMRVTVNGERVYISTKQTISENNWNAEKGMAKGFK